MKAGRMREKIDLLQPVPARTETGAETITWNPFATVWAEALPLAGREYFDAKATVSEASTKFRFRFISGVSEKMRVRHRGALYDIENMINAGLRDRQIELLCASRGLET